MRVLTTAAEINEELMRLIEECSSCQMAVAWASVGFKAFRLLENNALKIERMVVGTQFYQTDPQFIETFLTHPATRFVLQKDNKGRVFHPKVYLFKKTESEWECLVGSPNFTAGGVRNNDEIAVLVTHEDQGATAFLSGMIATIESYWRKAVILSPSDLKAYQDTWNSKQPALEAVQGPLQAKPILTCTWAEYYEMLRYNSDKVPQHYSIEGRLQVIREIQALFATHLHFEDIEPSRQKQIAGTLHYRRGTVDGVNYLWFGSMWGAGMFKAAINHNDPNLSLALDAIPSKGEVSRAAYLEYIERFKKAFPQGRDGLPMATRLLAMKRPDVFVCLDSKNEAKLYEDFGIAKGVKRKDYRKYWDSIIVPLMASPWWKSSQPESVVEREVWEARAAFLDCLYYEGIDLSEA
jgi:HKD family nuclease